MSGPMMVVFAVFWASVGAGVAWLVLRGELEAVHGENAELRERDDPSWCETCDGPCRDES